VPGETGKVVSIVGAPCGQFEATDEVLYGFPAGGTIAGSGSRRNCLESAAISIPYLVRWSFR
jgi:hypothetical protein